MPLTLHIEALASGGDAIARHEGRVVFVPGAVPGDEVEAEIVREEDRALHARLVRVVKPSAERRESACPHFGTCGGCQWLTASDDAQAKAKESLFYEALARIGGVARERIANAAPLLRSQAPQRYRHRAKLHLVHGKLGLSARASHDLVEIDSCVLLEPSLEAALGRLRAAMHQLGPVPRCSDVSLASDGKRVTVAFHVSSLSKPALEKAEQLIGRAKLDGGVVAPEEGAAKTFGKAVLNYAAPLAADGVVLHGRADLFAQANQQTNDALVRIAMDYAGSSQSALELFSGTGNFTFALANRAASLVAVESAADSVELARRTVREAKLSNIRFLLGDAMKMADALAREGQQFDVLLLDPPRTGARGIGPLAKKLSAKRVVYVSCDPATLARDVKDLVSSGYSLRATTPVDMFPQTFHLESVALLEAP